MSDQSMTGFNDHSLSLIPEDENLVPTQMLLPTEKNNINKDVEKKEESKSISELEFEELKGFKDLGFVFSEEDKNSSLVSIIPGLRRLGKNGEEDVCDESLIQRPYLSEAWEFHKREMKNSLMNWKVPAMKNEVDMKNNLKLWAHTVASVIRLELELR